MLTEFSSSLLQKTPKFLCVKFRKVRFCKIDKAFVIQRILLLYSDWLKRSFKVQNLAKLGNSSFEEKVVDLIEKINMPVSIKFVATKLEISWTTARALLLALTAEGRINGQRTTTSWIFSKKVNKTN